MTDECASVRENLPEFAFGVLTGAARAEVAEHVAGCRDCRAQLTELSGPADAITLLAPEREPSELFTGRVVGSIRQDRARSRSRLRTRTTVAIGAVVAALLLLIGGIVIGRATGGGAPVSQQATEVRERLMIGAGGRRAGRVFLYADRPAWAVVSLDYGTLPAGSYGVAATGANAPGTAGTVGTVTVDASGRGSWAGSLPSGSVEAVRVVDGTGHVLCEARFDRSPSADAARS